MWCKWFCGPHGPRVQVLFPAFHLVNGPKGLVRLGTSAVLSMGWLWERVSWAIQGCLSWASISEIQTWQQTKEQSPCTESDAINTWSINQRFGNHARYSIPVKYINRSDVWVSNRIQSHVYLAQIAATATSPSPRITGAYDGGLLQGENGRASTCNEEDLGPTEMRSIGQGPIVLICLGYV